MRDQMYIILTFAFHLFAYSDVSKKKLNWIDRITLKGSSRNFKTYNFSLDSSNENLQRYNFIELSLSQKFQSKSKYYVTTPFRNLLSTTTTKIRKYENKQWSVVKAVWYQKKNVQTCIELLKILETIEEPDSFRFGSYQRFEKY